MSHVISLENLSSCLGETNLVIVDARFVLGQPDAGRTAYEAAHIPGAIYIDLEHDLSAPIGEHGGRHPLPNVKQLTEVFGKLGIDNEKSVVAYDDQGGAMASRLWWLLRYVGHDDVSVLDQGFAGWNGAGYPVTSEVVTPVPAQFVASIRPELLVDVYRVREAVAAASGGEGRPAVLIDSRDGARYRGEVEPIDRVAGHIPSAINRPFTDGRNADGKWRPASEQATRFADLPRDREIIVYCGSGVTATPNVMALLEAGFDNVKLYAGSWSDWISYEENPVATGEE